MRLNNDSYIIIGSPNNIKNILTILYRQYSIIASEASLSFTSRLSQFSGIYIYIYIYIYICIVRRIWSHIPRNTQRANVGPDG